MSDAIERLWNWFACFFGRHDEGARYDRRTLHWRYTGTYCRRCDAFLHYSGQRVRAPIPACGCYICVPRK